MHFADSVGVQQKVLKLWPSLRMKQKKRIPCLRPKAKNDIQFKEKTNTIMARKGEPYFTSVTLKV